MNDPRRTRPPALAESILSRILPRADRDPILGDLAEEYRRRSSSGGPAKARWWYRRQVARSMWPALRRRMALGREDSGEVMTMGRGGMSFSWLDVKLGMRMLAKHPVTTLAAVFALAVGIPVGMGPAHAASAVSAPLPEDPENRVRALRYWNVETNRDEYLDAYEFTEWRGDLTTFESLGAFRMGQRNLSTEAGVALVPGAEVTASVFAILGSPPLLGRTFGVGDETQGSPDVALIGYDLWQQRFEGAEEAVGRTLRLGETTYTVVGVMPRGFFFPAYAELWTPLHAEAPSAPGQTAPLEVFGRLASGVGTEEAQAQVATLSRVMSADFPEARRGLQAQVVPFGIAAMSMPAGGPFDGPFFYPFQAFCFALLLVACVNVAMLMFARTAPRFRELGIRHALGAGRGRIVSQMVVESLLLAVLALAPGLLGYRWLVNRMTTRLEETAGGIPLIPYWFDTSLTGEAVTWAVVLALLSAVVVGVIPGLKVTGKHIQRTIQRARADRSGVRFGGVTGALIVADVAVAVTAIGFAIGLSDRVRDVRNDQDLRGLPTEEYLVASARLPSESRSTGKPLDSLRVAALHSELIERLEREPRVRSVAVGTTMPRGDHRADQVVVEGSDEAAQVVSVVQVDVAFFDGLGQSVIAGRDFDQADLPESAAAVIVNTSFVDRVLGGRSAVGQRIRFLDDDGQEGPAHEIVGVVPRLGMNVARPGHDAGVYLPSAPGTFQPVRFAIHLDGAPETFEPRLREIVQEIDAEAVVAPPEVMARVYHPGMYFVRLTEMATTGLVIILIAMAGSGLYAILSFAVAERTREIGIRRALGAPRGAIMTGVGRRPLLQIALGTVLGMPLAGWAFGAVASFIGGPGIGAGMSVGVAFGAAVAAVSVIGLLSFLSPMRRALRIRPTEALRGEM